MQSPCELASEGSWLRLKSMLERDSEFLRQRGLGDYSLLVVLVRAADKRPGNPGGPSPGHAPFVRPPLKRVDTTRKLGSLLQNLAQRFRPPKRQTPAKEDLLHWSSWHCADQALVYMGIIDFLSPWASLNIGETLSIPHGRMLEYAVMRHFNPGASLLPPDLYQVLAALKTVL